MEYVRNQYNTLKVRIEEPRKFIQVIAGPRQVGKTTLINQVLRQIGFAYAMEVADGVDAKDTDWIRRVWDSARTAMLFRKEKEYLLVIDEIQKIANWSEAVKKEWDEDTRKGVNLKVVLLGSSRLLLKKVSPTRLAKGHFMTQVEEAEDAGATAEQLKDLLGKGRAKRGIFEGDLEQGELEIGQAAAMIDHIETAAEVVEDMVDEYNRLLNGLDRTNF